MNSNRCSDEEEEEESGFKMRGGEKVEALKPRATPNRASRAYETGNSKNESANGEAKAAEWQSLE